MLSPEKRLSGFLEELYRYRVALTDQRRRVQDAGVEARRGRGAALDRGKELLFSPDPQSEVMRELETLQYTNLSEVWRLKNEVQFLLVAVRGIILMSKALERITTGEHQTCVSEAIREFESTAPDAQLLRNIHEHMDEYFSDERSAGKLPDPSMEGGIGISEEGGLYCFLGGKAFVVSEMATAAEALATTVAECVKPPESGDQSE